MATPSKKASDSDPLRRAYDFNPLHTTASDLDPEPAIVPGEPVMFTFRTP